MALQSVLSAAQQLDGQDLGGFLGEVARPKGVHEPVITYGNDHSDDPAVWVVFPVTTDIKLTKRRISELSRFAEEVRSRLRELRLVEIAYVRFSEIGQDGTGE